MNLMRACACAVGALAALGACKPMERATVSSVQVQRSGPGTYELKWSGDAGPVDVYVADQADAPRQAMRLAVDNDRDGHAQVTLPPAGRRAYFYVAPDRGEGVWAAERVLPLEGGRNFRDLGGYPTADGRRVKWGKLYRSGSMAGLTAADYRYLSALGIKAVCDLRSTSERDAEPNSWVKAQNIPYWARDYEVGAGVSRALFSSGDATAAGMKAAMTNFYGVLPFEQSAGYREIFKRLAAGEIPLAFNCSAGKDRAGTGAALILAALGVPRETVVADYALSDKVVDYRKLARSSASSSYARLSPDVLAPLMASDPAYIRAMFAAIEHKHGSVANYLRDELGVTDAQLQFIRTELLE